MRIVLRRLLIVLVAVALAGGAGIERLHAAPGGMPDGMPCGMMMMPAAGGAHAKPVPCKGMTTDCLKRLGCGIDAALPPPRTGAPVTIRVSTARYWRLPAHATGWTAPPDPWPPRTT